MTETLRYAHIRRAMAETPWAILPEKLGEIAAFVGARARGESVPADLATELQAAAERRPKLRQNGDIAVMPIVGTIAHRAGGLEESSGGTSVETLRNQFRALINDPTVAAIVLDVDSPGGIVSGIEEFALEIYRARGLKPISAVANTLCASAAYWLASAADEVVATPSALVGSVGVFGMHQDLSRAYDQLGVTTTLVSAGRFKVEGNPFEPLGEEARAALQKRVDESYDMFVKAVARGRGAPVSKVREGYAEGRVVGAREAVQLGMADRVATLDDVIATIGRRRVVSDVSAAQHGYYSGSVSGNGDVWHMVTTSGTTTTNHQPPLSIEEQSEAVLTAASEFVERARVLTARRERDGRALTPAHVAMLEEHAGAYRALAGALGELLAEPIDQGAVRALELAFLAQSARRLGVAV